MLRQKFLHRSLDMVVLGNTKRALLRVKLADWKEHGDRTLVHCMKLAGTMRCIGNVTLSIYLGMYGENHFHDPQSVES